MDGRADPGSPSATLRGATLIGDIVASRNHPDQLGLLRRIAEILHRVNERVPARQPLALTVGDEFQAFYEKLEEALLATTLLRLASEGQVDLRFGVGWGEIVLTAPIPATVAQSGAAWWRARDAIERVADRSKRWRWPRSLRTWFVGERDQHAATINAFLICRDHILACMNEVDHRIAWSLFTSERQAATATALGLPQSKISRYQNEHGPAALFQAHEALQACLREESP